MLTYTRIPLTVGAIQWLPGLGINTPPVDPDKLLRLGIVFRCWKINTPAGWKKLNSQDWILMDVNGNYDTMPDYAFRAQFEKVDDDKVRKAFETAAAPKVLESKKDVVRKIAEAYFQGKPVTRVDESKPDEVMLHFADGTKGLCGGAEAACIKSADGTL